MQQGFARGFCLFFTIILAAASRPAGAQGFDPAPAWPLCGRIAENPPAGWQAGDGCPAERHGNPTHSDAPFSSTFGPRPLASGNDRYDFHRGLDIATPTGTPIFAIADGEVHIAGPHSSYSDPLLKLRHYRPGAGSCSAGGGCYHSYYLHISDWVVGVGETVQKGQLIGYTGASGITGFQHLHFELRDAPAFDPFSAWSRDAIQPFGLLPYQVANDTVITFGAVDASDPDAVTAEVEVVSNRYDLVAVEITVLDAQETVVPQPGATPDANGYHVLPPFFDLNAWNFEYSHKDSGAWPWEDFGPGGAQECPYAADHGPAYSAHVHLDQADPQDYQVGLFNGVRVSTGKYWLSGDRDYRVGLEFLALQGPAACLEATAVFASGDTASARWAGCAATPPPPPPAIILSLSSNRKGNRVGLDWDGAGGNRVDIERDGQQVARTRNDGSWTDRDVSTGVTYRYRVCEQGSSEACSAEQSINL